MSEEYNGNAACKHCGAHIRLRLTGEHYPGPDDREWWMVAAGSACHQCGWAPRRFLEWPVLVIPMMLTLPEAVHRG